MAGAAGKILLADTTAGIACNGSSTPCTAGNVAHFIDLVGWGTANYFEGSVGPATSTTLAIFRASGGCTDTDNNGSDFAAAAAAPRNSASPLNVCEAAPAVSSTTPASGATGIALDADVSVTFSEAVNVVAGSWFSISCTSSGAHTAAESGGPTTFTLNPGTDFVNDETCTVTVYAAQVSDQDANDPPDNMLADYSWSFTALPLADAAPAVSSTTPTNGATNIAPATSVVVNFSEPVDVVAGSWFSISCTSSGAHTATESGGPTSFTLDPDTDFAYGETCTVTVYAAQVSDQDTNDPPDNMAADYPWSFATVSLTHIHDIQGSGATSPMVGQVVTIEGVVVGDWQGASTVGLGGFSVQEEDADKDADPLTSEGIFVYNSSTPVAVGDLVRVTGTVMEYASGARTVTELSPVASVSVVGSAALPADTPVAFPVTAVTDLERYEGMRVSFAQTLTVSDNYDLGRYGEVLLSSIGRLLTGTHAAAPGAPANTWHATNLLNSITLDDGISGQNPDPLIYPAPGLTADNTLRAGDTLASLVGVLDDRAGIYMVEPVGTVTFTHANPRAVAPDAVGGNLKVAALNTLNYFTTLDNAGSICGPLGTGSCRGADTAEEFTRQRAKLVNAVTTIDADIFGLLEIENDLSSFAISDLVTGLNDVAGAGTYAYIDTGAIGTDSIRSTIVYKPAVVTPVGAFATITTPPFDYGSRPPLAQTFELNSSHARFTVVVNHLRSKGSCPASGPDTDQGDGQGCWNVQRTTAATIMGKWLLGDPGDPITYPGDPTGSNDPDFLLLGDMNAYRNEDPITAFTTVGGFINLIEAHITDPYSYSFDGEWGYLDHALSTSTLASQVSDVTEWHNNADEPSVLDYNTEFKTAWQITNFYSTEPYRVSDHDPVIVGINLNSAPTVDAGGPYSGAEGSTIWVTATGNDFEAGALTYAWDLDNNGSYETPGQTVAFSGRPAGVYTVGVRVTDAGGLTGTDTATVTVTAQTDLSLAALATPPVAAPGDSFAHAFTVTNLGPSPATGVTLTITLPAGAAVGTITPGACSLGGSTVTCTVGGLAKNATFTASVTLSAAVSGSYTSQGSVTGTEPDPDTSDNTAEATTVVGQVLVAPSPVVMRVPVFSTGQTTLTITNDSPLSIGYWHRRAQPPGCVPGAAAPWPDLAGAGGASRPTGRPVPPRDTSFQPAQSSHSRRTATLDFDPGLAYPWGIGFNTRADDLWLGNIAVAGGDDLDYRFLPRWHAPPPTPSTRRPGSVPGLPT